MIDAAIGYERARLMAAKQRDLAALALYEERTGIKLPILETFQDDEGNIISINIHATVSLVRRASETWETSSG